MSSQQKVLLALIVAALVGCAPGDRQEAPAPGLKTLRAKVNLDKGKIEIDYRVHDSALVYAGDRVEWHCDCDPGIEFAVEGPDLVIDIENLTKTKMKRDRSWNREAVQALAQGLQEPPDYGPDSMPAPDAESIAAARAFLEAIAAAFPEAAAPALFERPVPRRYFDSNQPIPGGTVKSDVGEGVWKFTWKFRLKEDPTVKAVWDPHLYSGGHGPSGT